MCCAGAGTGPAPSRGLMERRTSLPAVPSLSLHSPRLLENRLYHETCNSLPRYLTPSKSGKKKKKVQENPRQEHLSVSLLIASSVKEEVAAPPGTRLSLLVLHPRGRRPLRAPRSPSGCSTPTTQPCHLAQRPLSACQILSHPVCHVFSFSNLTSTQHAGPGGAIQLDLVANDKIPIRMIQTKKKITVHFYSSPSRPSGWEGRTLDSFSMRAPLIPK